MAKALKVGNVQLSGDAKARYLRDTGQVDTTSNPGISSNSTSPTNVSTDGSTPPPGLNGGSTPAVISSGKGQSVIDTKVVPTITSGKDAINNANANANAGLTSAKDANTNGIPDDIEDAETKARAQSDADFKTRQDTYRRMAIANTNETASEISGIRSAWDSARGAQLDANSLEQATYQQSGFRSGASRYAPELQANVMADVQNQGIQRLQKIDTQYQSAISKSNAALLSGNLQLALQAANDAKQYHQDALDEIVKQREAAQKFAEKAQEAKTKLSRQASIVGLIKQGITDPSTLFDQLNYDDDGNPTGDITTDEIDGVLKNILPHGDGAFRFSNDDVGKLLKTGLSSQDVQHMQDDLNEGGVDSVLAGLTGGQKAIVSKVLSGVSAGSGGGVGGSLTISEARGLGLPLSLVGANQSTILSQLSAKLPPSWFKEYVENNSSTNYTPEKLGDLWSDFRGTVQGNFVSGKTAGSAKSGGSGISDEDIDAALGG